MTDMTTPARTRRLAALMQRPGGMTATEAAIASAARLAAMQDQSVQQIDATLARMQAVGLLLAGSDPRPALDELYVLSNAVFGVAGLFGLATLGDVAYSLCELIDRLRDTGGSKPAAIQVHLDSLLVARQAGTGSSAHRAILEGLRQVRETVVRA